MAAQAKSGQEIRTKLDTSRNTETSRCCSRLTKIKHNLLEAEWCVLLSHSFRATGRGAQPGSPGWFSGSWVWRGGDRDRPQRKSTAVDPAQCRNIIPNLREPPCGNGLLYSRSSHHSRDLRNGPCAGICSLCVSLFGLTNLVNPGCLTLQRCRL